MPPPDWPGPDRDRPLSSGGLAAAQALAAHLSGRPVRRILSSARRRCLETVAPLAAERGLRVEVEPSLDEEAAPGDARSLLAAPSPGLVICSHRNVIADLLAALAEAGVMVPGRAMAAWASVWELAVEEARVCSARYRPPPG